MIDVSDAFEGFLTEATLIITPQGTRDNNGNWVEPTPQGSIIQVVAQSLTPDERLALPEAVRTKETFKFHTISELKTADEVLQTNADVIVYDGDEWELTSVFKRKTLGGYYKAIGVKQ